MYIDAEKELLRELSEEWAKEIEREMLKEFMNPYSSFNDPDGSKRRARDLRKDRKNKLNKIYK